MRDETIERVAKAIANNHHKWNGLTEDGRETYRADARAAIAAMPAPANSAVYSPYVGGRFVP